MKQLKLFAIALMTAVMAMASCSKDDDNGSSNQGDPFSEYKTGWTDNGTTSYYKYVTTYETKASFSFYLLFTVKFDGTGENALPTSVILELGCPNDELAIVAYESIMEEYGNRVTRSGRVVKVDMSNEFSQVPKATLKPLIEQLGTGFKY